MGKRLIISEEERNRISGMYNLVNEQSSMQKPKDAKTLYNIMTRDYKMDRKVADDLARHYKGIIDGGNVGSVYNSFQKKYPDVMVPAALILRFLG